MISESAIYSYLPVEFLMTGAREYFTHRLSWSSSKQEAGLDPRVRQAIKTGVYVKTPWRIEVFQAKAPAADFVRLLVAFAKCTDS